jgi:uncharacterized membrane protein YhaH (DUF805 family)
MVVVGIGSVICVAAAATQEFVNEVAGHTAVDIVMFLFLFPQFVITMKRAHDRNVSTWIVSAWLLLIAYNMIAGVISLALLIELCFRRGTNGPNRYRPDLLAKA